MRGLNKRVKGKGKNKMKTEPLGKVNTYEKTFSASISKKRGGARGGEFVTKTYFKIPPKDDNCRIGVMVREKSRRNVMT